MQDGGQPTGANSTIPHSNQVDTNRRVVQLKGLPNCNIFRSHQHSPMMGMVSLGMDKCPGYQAIPRKRVNTVIHTIIADASMKPVLHPKHSKERKRSHGQSA